MKSDDLLISSVILWVILAVALVRFELHKKKCVNFFFRFLFTACLCYIIGSISMQAKNPKAAFEAMCMLFGTMLAIGIYALLKKEIFEGIVPCCLMFASLISLALLFIFLWRPTFMIFDSTLVIVLIIGLYLIHDTRLIYEGTVRNVKPNEYILGSLIIYIDMTRLLENEEKAAIKQNEE